MIYPIFLCHVLLQDMAGLITPAVAPERVAQFLWEHICHDTQVLMNAVGKSLDDCVLLVNLLMCNLMTPPQGRGSTSLFYS